MTELVEAAATQEEREALGFRAWPTSGEQLYRVHFRSPNGGIAHLDVTASTGDEAADKAVIETGGAFVTNIAPAPTRRTLKAKAD